MIRSPTFSPAAETTTPPRTCGSAAPRPSPPGPTSPASPWLHNHAYRRASLSPSRGTEKFRKGAGRGRAGRGLHIPTILTTAYPDDGVRERALAAGVIGYLSKPFDENDLLT